MTETFLIIGQFSVIIDNSVSVFEISFSDQNLVKFDVNIASSKVKAEHFSFRNIKKIDAVEFANAISHSLTVTSPLPVDDYVKQFETDVVVALDRFTPLKHRSKHIAMRLTTKWMSGDAKLLKQEAPHYFW